MKPLQRMNTSVHSLLLDIPECPIYRPTAEEFKRPIAYLNKIRHTAEKYGIIKIIPPDEYATTHTLSKTEFKFKTKLQNVHQLQNRKPDRKRKLEPTTTVMQGSPTTNRRKKRRVEKLAEDEYEFGYGDGDCFSLSSFSKMADSFKTNYFSESVKNETQCTLSRKARRKLGRRGGVLRIRGKRYYDTPQEVTDEDIEQEYWNIVENPTKEVQVHYGSDLDCNLHGSGFPKHYKVGWNMNYLPSLNDSLLRYLCQNLPGINYPMMYIGMLFSSFCWHTEDNYLYSINYIHTGAPKTWYGVPASAARRFEEVMRKELPHLFKGRPDLLYLLITQLSPQILKKHKIPIYRMTHYEGEYMITFPRAYHAGFNNGFNVAESVNFAPPAWLPFGKLAAEHYQEHRRASAFSHAQLVYNAARNYDSFDPDVIRELRVDLEEIVNRERILQQKAIEDGITKVIPMPHASQANPFRCRRSKVQKENRICFECLQDCYLSAVSCKCTKDKVSCLLHYKNLCKCDPSKKELQVRCSVKTIEELIKKMEEAEKKNIKPKKKREFI